MSEQAQDPGGSAKKNKAATRTETFFSRPYAIPSDLADALTSVTLRVTSDGEIFDSGVSRRPQRIPVERTQPGPLTFRLEVQVDLAAAANGCQSMGISVSDVAFLVLVRNTRLRDVMIVAETPLDSLTGKPLALDLGESVPWLSGTAGISTVDINVYLVLLVPISLNGLTLTRGTWLASRGFQIASDSESFEFDPSPLTPEDAEREGIPVSTLVYVAYKDPDAEGVLHLSTEPRNSITVYVNRELLDKLVSTTSNQARQMISLLIKQETLQQLVALIAAEASQLEVAPTVDDMLREKTIAGRLLSMLSAPEETVLDEQGLYRLIIESPAKAQAHCYAAVDSCKSLQEYMGMD